MKSKRSGQRSRPLSRSKEALFSMFAARKSLFVDLLNWDLPVLGDQYEIDQFDNRSAHYIVLAETDGNHLGSVRLLPTTRPHVLSTTFPQLCDGTLPCASDVVEISRFCVDLRLDAEKRRQIRDNLAVALVVYAHVTGIATYTTMACAAWLEEIQSFGWHCKPFGPPQILKDQAHVALRIDITPETPWLLDDAGIAPTFSSTYDFVTV